MPKSSPSSSEAQSLVPAGTSLICLYSVCSYALNGNLPQYRLWRNKVRNSGCIPLIFQHFHKDPSVITATSRLLTV